jgi:hypothetical protein
MNGICGNKDEQYGKRCKQRFPLSFLDDVDGDVQG